MYIVLYCTVNISLIIRDVEPVAEATEVTGVHKDIPECGFTWRERCEERQ